MMKAVVVFPMAIDAVVKVVLKPLGRLMLETLSVVEPALEMVMESWAEEPTNTLLKLKLPLTAMARTLGAALAICAESVRNARISTIRTNGVNFRYREMGMAFPFFKFSITAVFKCFMRSNASTWVQEIRTPTDSIAENVAGGSTKNA